jgi:hypothetical protein
VEKLSDEDARARLNENRDIVIDGALQNSRSGRR